MSYQYSLSSLFSSPLLQLEKLEKLSLATESGHKPNFVIYLSSLEELYYERLNADSDVTEAANEVDVTFQYDEYGNIKSTSISSGSGTQLIIDSTYKDPDTAGWVIGNKVEEKITKDEVLLSHIKHEYLSGTTACTSRRKKIDVLSPTWFTTQYIYDGAGNNTEVKREGLYHQKYTYDSTYSYISTIRTYTSETAYLVERRTYNLAISSPLTIEKPNGIITQFEYDILERVVTISQGRTLDNLKVLEEISFSMEHAQVMEVHKIWNGLDEPDNNKRSVITYFDGLKRTTSVHRSRPDDLSKFICTDTRYDAAGRISSRSKGYLPGQTPIVTLYSYDPMSRLKQEVYFPEGQSGRRISRTIDYTYESQTQTLKISETLADSGSTSRKQRVIREMDAIPNADNPQAGNFVKLCVVKRTNELNQSTTTSFDRLARPVKITDPTGVVLDLSYDMLSRQISQSLKTRKGATFSHSSLKIEESQSTLKNEITGATVVTQTDWCGRLKSKVTSEETFTFTYDADQSSREQLSSVTSSKNIKHDFAYDDYGYLKSSTITLDSLSFSTSYYWTGTGQLRTIINPNHDTVVRKYYPDGLSLKTIYFLDGSSSKASLEFSSLDNEFGQPLTRTFGNGIISTSTSSRSGMLTSNTLTKSNSKLLEQKWTLDSFNKITDYDYTTDTTLSSKYEYDLSGELTKYSVGDTQTPLTYDTSGNIASKSGFIFTNDGWQVKSARDGGGTTNFQYSDDGKMTKKERGNLKTEMSYDTEGRLIKIDKTENGVKETTAFLYDFEGRLLRTTLPNNNVVIYVSQVYEVEIGSATPKSQSRTSYLFQKYRSAAYKTEYTEGSTTAAGTVYYFHNNNIGSTIAASDVNGAIITEYTYDASGKIVNVKGNDVARYKYSGKELIGTLYYFGARFYDPDIARFLTLDTFPVDLDNITPSCFNLYVFSRNDPVNYIDVNGNAPVAAWHWWVDGLLIGAGVAVLIVCAPPAGAGLLAYVAVGVAGGALIGGGFGGFVTDVQVQADPEKEDNNFAWGVQIGLGMLFGGAGGAVSGAAGGWVSIRFPALTLVNYTQGKAKALPLLKKFAFLTSVDTVVGGGGGALQQFTTNLTDSQITDKGEGVLQSFVIGLAGGAVFSAYVNALSEAHNLGPALTKAFQGVSKRIQQSPAVSLRSLRTELPPPQASLAHGDKPIIWYSDKGAYGSGPEFIDIPYIDDIVDTQL